MNADNKHPSTSSTSNTSSTSTTFYPPHSSPRRHIFWESRKRYATRGGKIFPQEYRQQLAVSRRSYTWEVTKITTAEPLGQFRSEPIRILMIDSPRTRSFSARVYTYSDTVPIETLPEETQTLIALSWAIVRATFVLTHKTQRTQGRSPCEQNLGARGMHF